MGEWSDFVTHARAKKNQQKMLEQEERLDLLDINALSLAPESVFSDMDVEWELNTHREVYDGELFTNKKGVSLDNVKAKLNTKLPVNERLTEEDVFALKPSKRELVTRIKFTTKHRTDNIRALLRPKQGKDVFAAVAKAMLDAAPFSAARDQHHLTEAELQQAINGYLDKTQQELDGEVEPGEEGEDGPSEDDSSEESSSQRPGLGVRGAVFATFTKTKKKGNNKDRENKGGDSAAAKVRRKIAAAGAKPVLGSPRRRQRVQDIRARVQDQLVSDDEGKELEVDDMVSISSYRTQATTLSKTGKIPKENRMYDYEAVMAGLVPLKSVNIVFGLAGLGNAPLRS